MTTYVAKPGSIKHDWFVVDATNLTLGRLAAEIAKLLRGKHKPEYTQHIDVGDHIVVLNAGKVRVTGNKRQDKMYYWHSGYPGGLKSANFEEMIARDPIKVIKNAVKGMLPKNTLGRNMLKKLKVYKGSEHAHSAQQPQQLNILEG